jgi:phage antirepressor YoqD-like protein
MNSPQQAFLSQPPDLPNFFDPVAAARAWADAVEATQKLSAKVEQLEHQVAELAPAAAGLDLIAKQDGSLCITEAAKTLQIQRQQLIDMLLQNGWTYHRPGKPGYLASQGKIRDGYLIHKMGQYEDPHSGQQKVKEQVLVTPRGLTKLACMVAEQAARASPTNPI